jgi:hypothetical protein
MKKAVKAKPINFLKNKSIKKIEVKIKKNDLKGNRL